MKKLLLLGSVFTIFIVIECISTQVDGSSEKTVNPESATSIADMLLRKPGVRLTGNYGNYQVRLSGATDNPLIVLDKQITADDINSISNLISVQEVSRIEIMRTTEGISRYGRQGKNGVILIFRKK